MERSLLRRHDIQDVYEYGLYGLVILHPSFAEEPTVSLVFLLEL
jgi:hypothetical protein